MILISSDQYDYSTNHVIDWLVFLKREFIRINKNDNYEITFNNSKLVLNFKGRTINFDKIEGYFYRRGKIHCKQNNDSVVLFNNVINEHSQIIDEYINYKLENKISIGKYSYVNINKLIVLEVAKEVGLKIPNSYILQKKSDIPFLYILNSELITKNHSNSSFFQCDDGILIAYTTELNNSNYQQIPKTFAPSLFQQKIDKKYELRIFYLNSKMWSMAIFSQSSTITENDSRKVTDNIIRNVPYILPIDMEEKIIKLMTRLNLDTGSIDLLVNKKNEYIFLEVNPIGQFGSLSSICNYNIEKEIANFLVNEHL